MSQANPIFLINDKPSNAAQFTQAALDVSRHCVIEACAGSGKTWLLVARLLRLLLSGATPESIVAITFTRKAAQEMAQRLHDWLNLLQDFENQDAKQLLEAMGLAPTPALQLACRQIAHLVIENKRAPFTGTFHEWFGKVAVSAPVFARRNAQAGLNENLTPLLLDAKRRFWQNVHADKALQAHAQLLNQAFGASKVDGLLELLDKQRGDWAHAELVNADALAAWFDFLAIPTFEVFLANFQTCVTTAGRISSAIITGKKDPKYAVNLAAAFALGEPLLNATANDCAALHQAATALYAACYTQEDTPRTHLENNELAQNAGLNGLLAALPELALQAAGQLYLSQNIAPASLAIAQAYLAAINAEMQAQQTIGFSELETEAARLLAQAEENLLSRSLPSERLRHILVDEFQDTNPLQWAVLARLFKPLLAESAAGDGAAVSVFMVGDPKQSIYRFRGSEPKLFNFAANWLHQTHNAYWLKTQHTRRNAPAVNDFVNKVFAAKGAPFAAQSTEILAGKTPGELRLYPAFNAASKDAALEAEAVQLAQDIVAWVAGEPQRNYGDVMVLVRQHKNSLAIVAALQNLNVPLRFKTQASSLALPAVQDMLCLLRLMCRDNDGDTDGGLRAGLAQLQSSGFFGAADARVNATDILKTQSATLGELNELSTWAQHLAPHAAIMFLIARLDLAKKISGESLAALLELSQAALDFQQGRAPNLATFLAAIGDESLKLPMPDNQQASDAVLISTYHGAKGLEAKLVVMPHMAARGANNSALQSVCAWNIGAEKPQAIGFAFDKAPVSARLKAWQEAQLEAAALEKNTLLYVAFTRAKEALWLSSAHKINAEGYPTDTQRNKEIEAFRAAEGAVLFAPARLALAAIDETAVEKIVEANTSQANEALSLPVLAQGVKPYAPLGFSGAAEQGFERNSLTHQGSAFHLALQRLLEQKPLNDDTALSLAQRFDLTLDVAQAAQTKALTALAALPQSVRELVSNKPNHLLLEQSWLDAAGNVLRPDCVAIVENEVWIIDFKLSFNPERMADYAAQLANYQTIIAQDASFSGLNIKTYLLSAAGEFKAL